MKKVFIVVIFLVSICLSFFAGGYFKERENAEAREQQYHWQINFTIDKIKNHWTDEGSMETLCSNIYAAYQYCNDAEMTSALQMLWNALVFDGRNLAGNENALIKALEDSDAQSISDIAMSMRMND